MQLFGDLGIFSFVRKSRLKWIGHVSKMYSKRKLSQVFNNNPQRNRLRGRSKSRWWNCVKGKVFPLQARCGPEGG